MDEISFSGTDGLEAEKFVRAVRKVAFAKGKYEDFRWMAQFASICLEGNALRWHATLDHETKNDWTLLEVALLKQYPEGPRRGRSSSREPYVAPSSSDSIPTPAAAPPSSSGQSAPPIPPPRAVSLISNPESRFVSKTPFIGQVKGRIRVECNGPPSTRGYLSRTLDHIGRHIITRSKSSMALQAQYYPSMLPVNLNLLNSSSKFPYLTGIWYGDDISLQAGSTSYMNIVAGDENETSFTQRCGPSNTAIWSVDTTGELKALWRDETNPVLINLTLAVHESGQDVVFVIDFENFAARYLATDGMYYVGRLTFEPM